MKGVKGIDQFSRYIYNNHAYIESEEEDNFEWKDKKDSDDSFEIYGDDAIDSNHENNPRNDYGSTPSEEYDECDESDYSEDDDSEESPEFGQGIEEERLRVMYDYLGRDDKKKSRRKGRGFEVSNTAFDMWYDRDDNDGYGYDDSYY